MDVSSRGPTGPLTARRVASLNQLTLAQRMHMSFGTGSDCISPVLSRRKCSPSRSVYARYLPSGDIAETSAGSSSELKVTCLGFSCACVYGPLGPNQLYFEPITPSARLAIANA